MPTDRYSKTKKRIAIAKIRQKNGDERAYNADFIAAQIRARKPASAKLAPVVRENLNDFLARGGQVRTIPTGEGCGEFVPRKMKRRR
jgi:hypothetical protein